VKIFGEKTDLIDVFQVVNMQTKVAGSTLTRNRNAQVERLGRTESHTSREMTSLQMKRRQFDIHPKSLGVFQNVVFFIP
jgi:DNA repair ATPase RecN